MAKKAVLVLFIIAVFSNYIAAQGLDMISSNHLKEQLPTNSTDTLPLQELNEMEKSSIPTLRSQFEKTNREWSQPRPASKNLARLTKNEPFRFSPEALYWINWKRDPQTIVGDYDTFDNAMAVVNPLFTPLVFRGGLLPKDLRDLELYDKDFLKEVVPQYSLYIPDTTLFSEEVVAKNVRDNVYNYVRVNHPEYFRYSEQSLPNDIVQAVEIKKNTYEPALIKVENEVTFNDVDAPVQFIPNRRYWVSHFESAIQFAQNYISPNWHKGGVSTLNLNNRQYFEYNYNKNKVQFTNTLEWKTNVFTAPKDTLRDYKIGDDVFRIHSNIGYKAFNKWYYTYDFTFQTQMFSNYKENTNDKMATFLSPFSINMGIGMKYELNKSFTNVRNKKLNLAINMAPISYTFMYSTNKNIDLARHGFEKNTETGLYERKLSQFGSTINATMNFQFNRNINWYSRFYYFTSYDRMLGEFENRLTMAISRFFSTTISLNLRYDDAVAKKEDYDTYLQINELLSFGFNYKW